MLPPLYWLLEKWWGWSSGYVVVNYHRSSPMASLVEKKPQKFWAGSLVSPFLALGCRSTPASEIYPEARSGYFWPFVLPLVAICHQDCTQHDSTLCQPEHSCPWIDRVAKNIARFIHRSRPVLFSRLFIKSGEELFDIVSGWNLYLLGCLWYLNCCLTRPNAMYINSISDMEWRTGRTASSRLNQGRHCLTWQATDHNNYRDDHRPRRCDLLDDGIECCAYTSFSNSRYYYIRGTMTSNCVPPWRLHTTRQTYICNRLTSLMRKATQGDLEYTEFDPIYFLISIRYKTRWCRN